VESEQGEASAPLEEREPSEFDVDDE